MTYAETVNAEKVVIANNIDAVYMGSARRPQDHVVDFADTLARADDFVGRDAVFAALEQFCATADRGYFDIVAEAGLGKTALAAAITRRRQAICFFASTSSGLTSPDQFLTHTSAALIVTYHLNYQQLPETVGRANRDFNRYLREAASTLGPGQMIWIVVDALDEADTPEGANPLLLPDELPRSVYVVVTRRPGPPLSTVPNTRVNQYTMERDDPDQDASVDAYLRAQAVPTARVGSALASANPPIGVDEFVARLKAASERNFMYLSYVLEDIASHGPADPPLDLDDLPRGLFGYYERFWKRLAEVKVEGWPDWNGLYRPVIERLGVVLEPVTAEWLGKQVNRSTEEVSERALERWQRVLGREQQNGTIGWRLVHRTFAEFLASRASVDLGGAHLEVAASYADTLGRNWAAWDEYGFRHTVSHFVEASRRSKPATRHPIVERLVTLATDVEFQSAALVALADPGHVERDLELALRATSEDGQKPAVFLLTRVALPLVRFRRQTRQPQPILEAAERGELQLAERRLAVFGLDIDDNWAAALHLVIAWLGAGRNPTDARRLLNQVRANHPGSPTLDVLAAHVAAALNGTPPPVFPLDAPPTLSVAEAIVARLSGSAYDSSLLAGFGPELMYQGASPDETFYLAHQDGPPLVAFTTADPTNGEPLLRRYVQIHAAYGYMQYRNGSLWALLDAVLRHPQPDWIRSWLAILSKAVLAPLRGVFQEGLELAALGVRAQLGDASALATLDQRTVETIKATHRMRSAQHRGQGDVWGVYKRRLAALAETLAAVPNRHHRAVELIDRARELHYGFAGFSAPAALRLAESVRIAMPGNSVAADDVLRTAQRSAHNINDSAYCARMTARVSAMRENWWNTQTGGAGDDLAAIVERLRTDPATSEFAARHVVGEAYAERDPTRTVPLPDYVRAAVTVSDLAEVYARPIAEFLRLNPGIVADQLLPSGTPVKVPDPGFAPFVATCLSAKAVADTNMADSDRIAVVRLLVPVASRDVTALDTVLARLLLNSSTHDAAALEQLGELAVLSTAETEDLDAPPEGELTALPA